MDEERVNTAKKERRTIRSLATKLVNKVKECLDDASDGVDDRKLRQFRAALKETSIILKELDKEILNYLYTTDTEDEICENEAEQASEIQEKIDYQLICVEDMLKEMKDDKLSVNSSSKSHSASRESIVPIALNDDGHSNELELQHSKSWNDRTDFLDACSKDSEKDCMVLAKAADIVRKDMFSSFPEFEGHFDADYVKPLVPATVIDNIDHIATSTTARRHLHSTGISLFQHPDKAAQYKLSQYDLESGGRHSQNAELPEY
eukprot:gene9986-18610_t